MSIRTVRNATTTQQKRNSVRATLSTVAVGVVAVENNLNLAKYATVADDGTPITYFGFDHIGVGVAQYDANPIP